MIYDPRNSIFPKRPWTSRMIMEKRMKDERQKKSEIMSWFKIIQQ